ncbi:MAG: diacylglycerol kinase [Pseudomonadota bacterium]|nr:diacylglycerol kinase [Pseudomonadota bacterium]MDE3037168.1 diacylglycerol kinase [Pseudomonadota bacterium]
MKNGNLLQRIEYALSGLKESWNSEQSFRIQVGGFAFVIMVLYITQPSTVWWALLLLTSGGVLAMELINTAVEKLIDHLHPDQHPVLKTVKDTLAGAVLVMSITALLVFAAFLWSRIST